MLVTLAVLSQEFDDILVTGECRCLLGYWGASCDQTCPGGLSNTCSRLGACRPSDGACVCRSPRAAPHTDCAACRPGFIGRDCSVAVMSRVPSSDGRHTATVTSRGLLTTFDGCVYRFYGLGEHVLTAVTLADGRRVTVSARHVVASPRGLSVGLDAVSIECQSRTLQLYGDGTVVIDGVPVQLYGARSLVSGVNVEEVGVGSFVVSSAGRFELRVDTAGRFLYCHLVAERGVCPAATAGLWGGCDDDPYNDFRTTGGTVLTPSGADATLDQVSIHSEFGASYRAATAFTRPPAAAAVVAGYGLHLNGSGALTDTPLCTFSRGEITLQVRFRAASVRGRGVLLSYRRRSPLSLLIADGRVAVDHRAVTRVTSLVVLPGRWHQLTVAWTLRYLVLYLFAVDGSFNSDFVDFGDESPFAPCGSLTVGQWNADGVDGERLRWRLDAVLDHVAIYNARLSVAEIRALAWSYLAPRPNLADSWTFDDGDGPAVADGVAGVDMRMTTAGRWRHPQWVASDVALSVPPAAVMTVYAPPKHSAVRDAVEEFCTGIVHSQAITANCSLGEAAWSAIHDQCVADGTARRDVQRSASVLASVVRLCAQTRPSYDLPAAVAALCRVYHAPFWTGCDSGCLHGRRLPDGSCECHDGYWRDDCSRRCATDCGDATCDAATGDCVCAVNRDAATDCATCAPGWHGRDCGIALSTAAVTAAGAAQRVCSLTGHVAYTMFDGQMYQLRSAGEFVLFTTADLSVYVRQRPCGFQSRHCATQLSVRTAAYTVVVLAPPDYPARYTVLLDGVPRHFDVSLSAGALSLQKVPPAELRISDGDANNIHITAHVGYLTVRCLIARAACDAAASGLCGNCDGDVDNDLRTDASVVVALDDADADTVVRMADHMQVTASSDVGFTYTAGDPRHYSGSDFALCLHGDSAATETLVGVVNSAGGWVTLEVRFKVAVGSNGTLLRYASGHVFGVEVRPTLRVVTDGDVHDTGLVATADRWQHLSVVYDNKTGETTAYLMSGAETVEERRLRLPPGVFRDGGVLSVGGGLDAQVDEVRVWSVRLSLLDALQSSTRPVDASYPNLTAQWSFPEGNGRRSVDGVTGRALELGANVTWCLPEEGLYGGFAPSPLPPNPLARAVCAAALQPAWSVCNALGPAVLAFHQGECERGGGDLAGVTEAALALATYCETVIAPETLTEVVCADDLVPDLSGQPLCAAGCLFGAPTPGQGCDCWPGYWGARCDAPCPGGALRPCNARGVCIATTGACDCDATWRDNCTVCSDGWNGPDCDRFEVDTNASVSANASLGGRQVASVTGHAHVWAFDGGIFTLAALGEFYAVRSTRAGLAIQVKAVDCYGGATCLSAVALRRGTDVVTVRSGFRSEDMPVIWHNGRRLTAVVRPVTAGIFTVVHNTTYSVSVTAGSAVVVVRQTHRYVSVSVDVATSDCDAGSLLGDCAVAGPTDGIDTSGAAWRVPPAESLFAPLYRLNAFNETRDSGGAGYALRLDGRAWLATDALRDTFRDLRDTTLDLFIRPLSLQGVVLSYGAATSLSVYLNGTVHVAASDRRYDTRLAVRVDEWQKLVVVWRPTAQRLSVHVIGRRGDLTSTFVPVTRPDLFARGGVLALGRWVQSRDARAERPTAAGYHGDVDELRVWSRAMSPSEMREGWNRSASTGPAPGLAALWKFDEGEGDMVADLVGSAHLAHTRYAWTTHAPRWLYSHAPLDVLPRLAARLFRSTAEAAEAGVACRGLLEASELAARCLSPAVGAALAALCTQDWAASGRPDAPLAFVLSVADRFHAPALLRPLCRRFPAGSFPHVVGALCSTPCQFGALLPTAADVCRCRPAFWGADCSRPCPPCHHGRCDALTGACVCEWQWRGDALCATCTLGLLGAGCSVFALEAGPAPRTASAAPHGFWTALDGAGYVYRGSGAHTFYEADRVLVELTQGACSGLAACVRAVAMRVDAATLAITAAADHIHLNGSVTNITNASSLTLTAGFTVHRTDRRQYVVSGRSSFRLTIDQQADHLDVHLQTASCESSRGLAAAPCHPDVSTEVFAGGLIAFLRDRPLTPPAHVTAFAASHRIPHSRSLMAALLGRDSTQRAALALRRAFAQTRALPNVTRTADVTFEVVFRATDLVGRAMVLFSYASDGITWSVNLEDARVVVRQAGAELLSVLSVDAGHWGMLAVVHCGDTGITRLVYVSDGGGLAQRSYAFPLHVPPGALGQLVLGGVIGTGGASGGEFTGVVDRVLIWGRAYGLADLLYHWQERMPADDPALTYMWGLDEGYGDESLDSGSATPLYLHPDCRWVPSHAPLHPDYVSERFPVVGPSPFCDWLFDGDGSSLAASCAARLPRSTHFHRAACAAAVTATHALSAALDPTLLYASSCQAALSLPSSPAQPLCAHFPLRHFPIWVAPDCRQRCLFGRADAAAAGGCLCDPGYWGAGCGNQCPGGAEGMCGGHGACGPTGDCVCELNWQGTSALPHCVRY